MGRRILMALLALVLMAVCLVIGARFGDGPVGFFPGGALTSGPWVEEPVADWSFATGGDTLEFQLLEPERSRTVWFAVHEGALYVPCGIPEFRLWKQWPHEVAEDGRAVIRLDGKRYRVQAVRVTDEATHAAVGRLVAQKYMDSDEAPTPETVWIFRFDPRSA